MQYMLLIYDNEAERRGMSQPRRGRAWTPSTASSASRSPRAGSSRPARALESVKTATTVRVRNGKQLVTDGPFAETREQLGGYYLVEAKDLDEARAIAARIPSVRTGSIEVRPVRKM